MGWWSRWASSSMASGSTSRKTELSMLWFSRDSSWACSSCVFWDADLDGLVSFQWSWLSLTPSWDMAVNDGIVGYRRWRRISSWPVRGWWWWWWVSKLSTTIDRFYEEVGKSRVCFMLRGTARHMTSQHLYCFLHGKICFTKGRELKLGTDRHSGRINHRTI
jgi:hypothetical protein